MNVAYVETTVARAVEEFEVYRRSLFKLYEAQRAELRPKEMRWSGGVTRGYWLAEWRGMRPEVERSAASIGEDEIKLFYDVCQIVQPQLSYVIGNSFGLSTFALSLAWPSGMVVAIDNWSEPRIGPANRLLSHAIVEKSHFENVRLVDGTSPADTSRALLLADAEVSLVFIDGLHRNDAAQADYEGVIPYLKPHSIVFWHNVNTVSKAFEATYKKHGHTLFDTQTILRTHGPMGVFFSRKAHPKLFRYLGRSYGPWRTWKRDMQLIENEQLIRSKARMRSTKLWRYLRRIKNLVEGGPAQTN